MEYLSEDKLKELVQRYSEFINFPILMLETRTESKEVRFACCARCMSAVPGVYGAAPATARRLQVRSLQVPINEDAAEQQPAEEPAVVPLSCPVPSHLRSSSLTVPCWLSIRLPQVPVEGEDAAEEKPAEEQSEQEKQKAEEAKEGETVEVDGALGPLRSRGLQSPIAELQEACKAGDGGLFRSESSPP